MSSHHAQPDYGTGQKKLSIYIVGVVLCVLLTVLAFWAVMTSQLEQASIFIIIFAAAVAQFLVQVVFFLRLNASTHQGKMNLMAFVFTGVILLAIIGGSLWIMINLNYNMMH